MLEQLKQNMSNMESSNLLENLSRHSENPENTKNVQIQFWLLMGIRDYLQNYAGQNETYRKTLLTAIECKLSGIRNRQAYVEVVKSSKSERPAALENYFATKKAGKHQ